MNEDQNRMKFSPALCTKVYPEKEIYIRAMRTAIGKRVGSVSVKLLRGSG
ncbi:MAG TPA: hypothetical protein VME23_15815 [Terracidiphilus sp.]|nr:hypothetical protein [Terracidiphilus sp.]